MVETMINYSTWKKILHEYALFCIMQYGLLAMVVTKFSMVFYYKVGNDIVNMVSLTVMFIVLMAVGTVTRAYKAKFKIIGGFLLTIGAILQVLYIVKLNPSMLTYLLVILYLITTVVMSIWAIMLFFAFDKEIITTLTRKNRKNRIYYFVAGVSIAVYVATILLYRHYGNQINALLALGTANRIDGLSAAQVIELVDAKVLQVDLLQTVFLIVISAVSFLSYRKWIIGPAGRSG